MRYVFWLLVAAYTGLLIWAAFELPERVPMHFNGSGEVDNWGSRGSALLTFALIGAGVVVLFGGMAWLAGRKSLNVGWINLPHKEWWTETPQRVARLHILLREDLYFMAAVTMGILVVALASTVWAGQQSDPRMPSWAMILIGVLVAAIIARAIWMVARRYRPQELELP
ncbi:DUF1648 domain-containing protein [Microlunatus elymi]|uniref:DUF1648 domain-containing protein n=1 Tax=Microlunatus elymi TaxID=2596828 RepID=A0A516PTN2_9ACTN|nr:DUF1648 domain-containing protein [Microlunatus elymi]QDP94527.1 DUF1648 domain-containing protein [Microlunatus elymi]